MAFRDVTREGVESALKEFDRSGQHGMLAKYGGGQSTRWYVKFGERYYDQKLILRAGHQLQGLGPLPSGRGTFTAHQAKSHLKKLGFTVVDPSPRIVHQDSYPDFRLFIIGAGFSQPAGLPLGKDLLQCVREDLRFYYDYHYHGVESPLEPEIRGWTSLYPREPIDLERVLAYSHRRHYLGLSRSDETFAHGSKSIVAAKEAIQRILIRETPATVPELYRDFAGRLRPGDVVLTFNYDTLLEQAFDDIGKPYTLTPEWWLSNQDTIQYVDLLKLHGSIDWYDRYFLDDAMHWFAAEGHCVPNRDPIFGPEPSVPSECLSRGPTEAGLGSRILSRVFRVPNHRQYFPIVGRVASRVVPFILPPAYDKLLGYDAILDIWENLHQTKDSFSSITVIGYSMPPYDSYAYEALGHLLVSYQQGGNTIQWGQHRRVPVQLITRSDSKQHALQGIPFLDPSKTRVWDQGFSTDALNWIDWGDGGN